MIALIPLLLVPLIHGLPSVPSCITEDKETCIFPFVYEGEEYYDCIKKSEEDKAICATETDKQGEALRYA